MADTAKQIVGKIGESEAGRFLSQAGFQIVDRNYWRKWGEIDIVARRGNDLRFVEVKTVTRAPAPPKGEDDEDYEPEDNIHPWKRKRLRRIIETYLLSHNWCDDLDWQVDAICVYLDKGQQVLKLEHLEDIEI